MLYIRFQNGVPVCEGQLHISAIYSGLHTLQSMNFGTEFEDYPVLFSIISFRARFRTGLLTFVINIVNEYI